MGTNWVPRSSLVLELGGPFLGAGPLGVHEGRPHGGASLLHPNLSAILSPPTLGSTGRPSPWGWGRGLPGAERAGGGGASGWGRASAAPPGPHTGSCSRNGGFKLFFLLANMHVVLIIYMQHLSPPNVLSGFGGSERARWMPRAARGRGGAGGEQEGAGAS